MGIVWKTTELEEGGQYSDVKKVVGIVASLDEGSWGEDSQFGDKPFVETVLEEAQILEMRSAEMVAPPLTDDEFRFRVNQSSKKNSKWGLYLNAAESLGIELPDGLLGRRVTFALVAGGRGKFTFDCLVPVEVEELKAADPNDRVVQFLESTDQVKVFKRACLLDPVIAFNQELVDGITSGDIFGKFGYEIEDDGLHYVSKEAKY